MSKKTGTLHKDRKWSIPMLCEECDNEVSFLTSPTSYNTILVAYSDGEKCTMMFKEIN